MVNFVDFLNTPNVLSPPRRGNIGQNFLVVFSKIVVFVNVLVVLFVSFV